MRVSSFLIAAGIVYLTAIVLAMLGSAYGMFMLMFIPVLFVVALVTTLVFRFAGKKI
jgi:uncharacterized membrane protein